MYRCIQHIAFQSPHRHSGKLHEIVPESKQDFQPLCGKRAVAATIDLTKHTHLDNSAKTILAKTTPR